MFILLFHPDNHGLGARLPPSSFCPPLNPQESSAIGKEQCTGQRDYIRVQHEFNCLSLGFVHYLSHALQLT